MANLLSDADVFGSAPSGLLSDADVFGKGAKTEPGGFVASAKQAIGATVKGAGQAAADFIPGVSQENALKRYGQEIIEANPTAVHSFSDLADKPWTAVKEATGNALSSMGGVVGSRALGMGITAAAPFTGPAAPVVAGVGQAISWLGPVAAAALPSFGGIREQQIHDDPNAANSAAAKAAAAVGAGTVGAIESRFGPEAWGSKMLTEAGRKEVAKLFAAKTLPQAVAKGAVRGAAVEGAEELAQNPVEQLAAFQNPLTAEALKDTAFSGAMGALGGGVLGGGTGAASRYLPKKPDVDPGNQPAEPPKALPAPTYTGTPGDQTLQATVDRQNAVDAAQAAADTLYNEHDAFERERAANMGTATHSPNAPIRYEPGLISGVDVGGPTEPPSPPGGGIDFTPPQLPDTGPLSRAANLALGASVPMERQAFFPFQSFAAAERMRNGRDDLVTRQHPSIPGRFTLVPAGLETPVARQAKPDVQQGTGSFSDQNELANFIADERKDQSARKAALAEGKNNAIAQADQAVADARQFATRNERLSILDGVLSSLAPGQNPNRRFDAALKAAGFRDTSFTEEERAVIGRYGNVASAFAVAPEASVEPSSPGEIEAAIPAAKGKGDSGIAGVRADRVRSAIAAGFTQRKGFSLINPATGEKFALKTPGMMRAAKEALEQSNPTTEIKSEAVGLDHESGSQQRPDQDGSRGNMPTVRSIDGGDRPASGAPAPGSEPAVSVGDGSGPDAALSRGISAARPRGPESRDDLLGAILRVTGGNGISARIALTVIGDTANRATRVRGLFTNRGTEDLDDTAELLRIEEGYDVRDGNHLAELIREQASGNPVHSMRRMEAEIAANAEREYKNAEREYKNAEREYKDEVRRRAAELGIRTVAVRFDAIERAVVEAETKLAEHEANEERLAIQAEYAMFELDDDQVNFLLEISAREDKQKGKYLNGQWISNEEFLNAFEPLEASEDEQGDDGAGQTIPGEAGGSHQEGSGAPGARQDFGLTGQTNAQASAQFAQQNAAESNVQTKEQADRERDAVPFTLGVQSQPKPQGVQTGLFTADGRVSAEAKPVAQSAQDKIKSLQEQLKTATPFEKREADLNGQLIKLVTKDAEQAISKGTAPAYRTGDSTFAIIHPSAQNDGMIQVTRYNEDGVFGDSQYNDVESAVRGGALWFRPRMSDSEAVAALDASAKAEEAYRKRREAQPVKATTEAKAVEPAKYKGPDDVSTRAGQMELANRAGTIAALKAMNEQLRKIAPDEAWADSNIEDAQNLDALRDQISQAIVDAQRGKPIENALRKELEELSGQELKDVFSKLNLAGKLMAYEERISALLMEDAAEVRAAISAVTGNPSKSTAQPEKPAEVTKPKNEQQETAGLPAATDGGSRPVPAVPALEETYRPLIERLIRNKRVAKELGFDIDGAIAKAKAAMAGTKQKPGSFRALAKRAEKKGDTETAAILNQVADLNDGRKAKATVVKDKPADALYSKGDETVSAPMPQSQAEQRIKSLLGNKVGRLLIESGIITFTNKGDAYQGATYTNGTIALNLDALSADNFAGVFAHEGFHSTIRDLVGEQTYTQMMKRLDTMLAMGKGAQWVKDADAAIPSDTKAEHRTEEIAAYSIEQYVNGAKQPNVIKRWVESLLSALRTAIIRKLPFGKLKSWAVNNLQPQDLANLAIAGLKAKARGQLQAQGREATAFSKINQTDTPAFKKWFGDSKVVDNSFASLLSEPDGIGILLNDLLSAQNASSSGLDPVQALMLALAKNDKIGRGIVGLVPVDVVNSFSKDGFRPKNGGGNTSMFVNALNAPVSDQVLSAFRGVLASLSTKLANAIATGRDQEVAPALFASDFNLREVGGLLSLQGGTDFWSGNTGVKSVGASETAKSASPGLGAPTKNLKLDAAALADLLNRFVSFAPHAKSSISDDLPSAKYIAKQGNPLVVYHGTRHSFDEFMREGRKGRDRLHYFTDDPAVASEYAGDVRHGTPNVMPVYVSLQKPFVFNASGEQWGSLPLDIFPDEISKHFDERNILRGRSGQIPRIGFAEVIRGALVAGYDGVVADNITDGGGKYGENHPSKVVVAHAPEQIKSAIGNNGNFDASNPDIRYSKASQTIRSAVGAVTWAMSGTENTDGEFAFPSESKMDDIIYAMQDKHIDLKRVVESIKKTAGSIADNIDPYLQEELFHGRAAKAVKDFLDLELRPLIAEMRMRGVGMADFEEYLWNRHAEERNAQIAKINPQMEDGGSGLKTADAQAYLAGLSSDKRKAYELLAAKIDAITAKNRQVLVESGLEKAETVAAWEGAYKHYVPLQREDVETGGNGTGQGFSVRGTSSKRAVGSGRPVADIIANLAMQRERFIVKAEKNRVSIAIAGLAASNPNPDFWKLNEAPKERVVNNVAIYNVLDANGNKVADFTRMDEAERMAMSMGGEVEQTWDDRVQERIVPGFKNQENVVHFRLNGEDHFVIFNEREPRAMRMAQSIKNLDMDQLGRVLTVAGKVTRYFAAINTQYNPIFGIINLFRDVQGALLNLSTTPLAGEQKRVAGYTVDALRGIYADIRAHRAGKVPSSRWAKLYEEFQNEGGQTGYRDQFSNAEQRAEAIAKEIKAMDRNAAFKAAGAVFDWLSDYNQAMENAVRLAAYAAAKERGLSKQQAASLAKNLTVNFNRKGQVATQMGALYAFFNASMQGTARLAQTLTGPMGRRIITGGVLLGSMQAMLLASAGMGDDEPPEFVRERNLILPIGDGKYISLPMPLGFHVLPNLGRIPTEFVMSGFREPARRISDLVGIFADAFNPIGNAGLSLQTIAPTVVDPFAALAENKDWTGKPIAKLDMNANAPTPGHSRAKDTATAWSKAISEAINYLSGGTRYKPGAVSPTPDQIDYLIGQVTGGVGREAAKVEQTATSMVFTGEDLPLHKVPLVGRFVGDTKGQSAEGSKFYAALKRINEHENEIKGMRKDGRGAEVAEYIRENPDARLVLYGNHVEREVQKLRSAKRDALERGDAGRVRMIESALTAKMRAFNERVRSAQGSNNYPG